MLRKMVINVEGTTFELNIVYDDSQLFPNVPLELQEQFIRVFQERETDLAKAIAYLFVSAQDFTRLTPRGLVSTVMTAVWGDKLLEAIDEMKILLERIERGEDERAMLDEFLRSQKNLEEEDSDQNLDLGAFTDFIEGMDLPDENPDV